MNKITPLALLIVSLAGSVSPFAHAAGAIAAPKLSVKPAYPSPVFDVRDFGAKGDGVTYDTAALAKAVDACAGTGGTVLLSGGVFVSAQL